MALRAEQAKLHYHVAVRRWFDKSGGNTYHSVAVTFPDGTVKVQGFTYGYGQHYEQTAFKIIAPKEPDDYYLSPWRYYEAHDIFVKYDVVDVTRKRDLHQEGE